MPRSYKQRKPKREPYDAVRVIHDSTETFSFEPDSAEKEAFRNRRRADGRLKWIQARIEKWAKEDHERRLKRLAQILEAVKRDGLL